MKSKLARFASALSLVALAACGGPNAVGSYDIDKPALKAAMLAAMPEQVRTSKEGMAQLDQMVEGTSATIELKGDGSASMAMKMTVMGQTMDDSTAGTWKLDGKKLTISMKNKEGADDTKVADFDGKSFTVEDDAGGQKMKMTFHRR